MSALVLLPGMDGSDKLFGPLRAAAPAGVDTIAVGYPPGRQNGYDDLLPLVRAQLPADRPFFLLGWSFSGPLALLAAADAAARAARRDPGGVVREDAGAVPAAMGAPPGDARAVPFLSGGVAREGAAWRLRDTARCAACSRRRTRSPAPRRSPAAPAPRCRSTRRDALAACPVPVLYLRARKDGVIRGSHADEIRRLRPSVEIADIDGPHLALVTNPAAAWAALTRFMDRSTRSARCRSQGLPSPRPSPASGRGR